MNFNMFGLKKHILVLLLIPTYAVQSTVNITTRKEWGARTPKETPENLLENPPPYIIIHHSETPGCTSQALCQARIRSIQDNHIDERHWNDIGYNFLIGEDGNVYDGRGWGIRGAHSPAYNRNSLGICFLGRFGAKIPTSAALNTAKEFLDLAVSSNKLQSNYTLLGHRQTKQTDCPGQKLYELIQTWPHWKNT